MNMNKRKLSPIDAFNALSDDRKEREYHALDREFTRAQTLPLTAEQRKAWRKFKERRRLRGRPKVGEGAKTVSLTIEGGLLKRADALAKREGLSRAQIVARGLKMLLRAS
jgi:hypothetical protein